MERISPAFHEDSVQSLFEELRERMRLEGADSYAEYRGLISELIQEKLGEGVFDSNEELPTIEAALENRWPEIEATLNG